MENEIGTEFQIIFSVSQILKTPQHFFIIFEEETFYKLKLSELCYDDESSASVKLPRERFIFILCNFHSTVQQLSMSISLKNIEISKMFQVGQWVTKVDDLIRLIEIRSK
jgi:hypothetical protein